MKGMYTYLDLLLEVPLEAGEEDLALRWLETVNQARDRPLVVLHLIGSDQTRNGRQS